VSPCTDKRVFVAYAIVFFSYLAESPSMILMMNLAKRRVFVPKLLTARECERNIDERGSSGGLKDSSFPFPHILVLHGTSAPANLNEQISE